MRRPRVGQRAVDPRLAAYVAEHWDDLLADAALATDDSLDRPEVVLGGLTRVALARPATSDPELEGAVRREIARAAARHLRRSRAGQPRQPHDRVDVDVVEVESLDLAVGLQPAAVEATAADPATPEPVTPDRAEADPVALLRARVGRARRRRAVWLAAGAAAVVAAAILVVTDGAGHNPGTSGTSGGRHVMQAARFVSPVTLPRSPEARPTGVAAGGGHLWTLELHPSGRRPETTVVERDLSTGRQEASFPVPGEDFGISYALGRVWVWGVESRVAVSVITGLDPTTGATWTKAVDTDVIEGAGFTAHRAWFTGDGLTRVLAVTPAGRFSAVHLPPPGASHVASAGPGSVVVSGASGVMQVLPGRRPVVDAHGPPTLLASTAGYGVWIGHGTDLSYRPGVMAPEILGLQLPLRVALVVGDPAHGVYVATSSTDPQHFDPYLVYYSPESLSAAHPRPSARLDGRVRVEGMAGTPHGGLVFVTTDGQIEAWDPAAVVAAPPSPGSVMR